jgi:hypothetical protein
MPERGAAAPRFASADASDLPRSEGDSPPNRRPRAEVFVGREDSMTAQLLLSAVELRVAASEFLGALHPYGGDEAFRALRQRADLLSYRQRGRPEEAQVLVVPATNPPADIGIAFSRLPVIEHLGAVAHFAKERLVDLLPRLELQRTRWGAERIRRKDDLIDAAFRRLGLTRPDRLAGLHRFHRTAFRVRREHMPNRGGFLAMTIEFRRHQELEPTIAELAARRFDLHGLEVFGTTEDGRKLWLGQILRADSDAVTVSDGEKEATLDARIHHLEPSTETFTRLFRQALGDDAYEQFQRAEWTLRTEEVCGRSYVDRLRSVADHLRKTGPLAIAPSISAAFGDIISLNTGGRTPSATQLPDVEYCFSWDRTNIHKYPANGLAAFGPFDGTTFDTKEPSLLVVCPADARHDVDTFVRALRDGSPARDNRPQRFAGGLLGIYRLNRLNIRFAAVDLSGRGSIAQRYVDVLRDELGRDRAPDVALVVVPDEHAFAEVDNPYLRAKAFLLAQGVPSQEVRLSIVRTRLSQLPFILENIAVAIYAKLGGCPWTIRPSLPITKEIVIGMAHAEFGGRYSPRRRLMGITTVFSSDGTYLLAAGSQRCEYDEYPQVLATSVRETLSRLAKEQRWMAGEVVRLVFHAPKPLTGTEIETIAEVALQTLDSGIQFESAFLTIEMDHPFKVVAPNEPGREKIVERLDGRSGKALVGECAPRRGLVVDLGRSRRLLCVNGPLLMKREGESIPQPLQISLHKKSTYTDMTALARQVFHFTGLSWRSMLPVTEPVTIFYPRLIAQLLSRLSTLPEWDDGLLDTRLRRSRWFL